MTEAKPAKLAILIDAENVLPSHAELIFSSAMAMGDVVAKEIYGVAAALSTWVEPVLKYAIHPNLTIKASKGKNTSDIALVIGAMDLLLAGEADTVVIASSDSDFSMLSVRLRTAGIHVIGMGTEKSNPLWRTACSSFVVLEHPAPQAQSAAQSRSRQSQTKQNAPRQSQQAPRQPQQAAQSAQPSQRQATTQSNQTEGSAPAPQGQTDAPVATHKDRAAVIQQVILRRLASNGGRVQVSTLFSALNRLPEYQADRQSQGKKPLNYLTSTFADVFDFENSADGKIWISAKGRAAIAEEARAADAKAAEAEAPETSGVETQVPQAAELEAEARKTAEPGADSRLESVKAETADAGDSARAEAESADAPGVPVEAEGVSFEAEEAPAEAEDASTQAVEPAEVPAEATPDPVQDAAVSDFIHRMIESGIDATVSENIARILAESDNLRSAYNAIRKAYGNAGREYYNYAKAILTGKQA